VTLEGGVMTDEPVPDREPAENIPQRENKGSDEQPWEKDEQPYADQPEQRGGAEMRTEPTD
jgi:hypothetical protein